MEFNKYSEIGYFEDGLKNIGIELSDLQKQQFIDYYELLVEKNKVMNLTAITDFKEVMQKHFIDSLSIIRVKNLTNESIIDIGTGAGFPGIPIKIAFPETNIVLLDSLNKRVGFLNEVIETLNLKNIKAIHGRAEDFAHTKEYRESFDIGVSRAVAKLSVLAEYCLPYVKKGGYFIPYKSGKISEEIQISQNALKILGSSLVKEEAFILPNSDIERSLLVIEKVKYTPRQYPRSAGKPAKESL